MAKSIESAMRAHAATLACCALGVASGCSPSASPLIEAGRAADIRIGDSLQRLEAAYPDDRRRRVDLGLEGMPSPALELMPEGTARADAVVAELIEQDGEARVWRIQVRDPLLETARGIGVGDTVHDLREAYFEAGMPGRLIGGEGNIGFRVEALDATFLLDADGAAPWALARDAAEVPGDVTIERILLTSPP